MRFWKWMVGVLVGGGLLNEAYSQKIVVKGVVMEAGTNEPLTSVTIVDSTRKLFTTTNRYGYFNVIPNKLPVALQISLVGYEAQQVYITKDTVLRLYLKPQTLQEVEVRASYQPTLQPNLVTLTPTLLNNLPSVGGEKDLLKAISIFSGVAAGSELSSGINVRGGANDQNLYYLDGAPIYSVGHLFNFLSLFNPDAVQRVHFYKGDFPVEYGGRLSSVTDVSFREGNKNRWEGKAEVGVVSAKFSLEGPIKTNKTSLLLTGRSAYLNLFNLGKKKAIQNHEQGNFLGYNFYDLNVKLNHSFNQNHKLFLSYYRGVDYYEVLQNSLFGTNVDHNLRRLTNQLLSVRSYHVLSSRLFLQTGLHFTQYAFRYNEGSTMFRVATVQPKPWMKPEKTFTKISEIYTISNGKIQDVSANFLADWTVASGVKAKLGADLIHHTYEPVSYRRKEENQDSVSLKEASASALEGGVFGSLMVNLSSKMQWNVGARYSYFQTKQVNYQGLEPRTSLTYRTDNASIQLSATRMIQYNHALVKSGGLTDKITWVPSTPGILPQSSWQYAVGWSQSRPGQTFKYSIGAYYKQMQNLSMYRYYYGDPYLYYRWEANTLSGGKGRAYGLELTAEKSFRRWSGGVNYTLSRNQRHYDELNESKWFNDLYDRRHILNLNGVYKMSKTLQLSFLWVYYSGQRYDLPAGRIAANPLVPEYVVYDQKNNGKYPDYHRLDVGLTKKYFLTKGRYWEINLNVYNLYSRKNTYRLYPAVEVITDEQHRPLERRNVIRSASVFPILPSISIAYKFR
ncbi:hypothetical protein DR864_13870 [Runella rosea]|uniref:TonB-dependent receptor plug domain-containing protein n=1 Tax=Runella rosea TaxID=2259595 RepID=A0A344TJD9_9BACT|nr:carboxypeptidase-like regulatory domain-containing protein [Runella rosea]AXE18760.1 hypothetical protein DR864_13870 [Runella rosea]